jgi:hypothetical protein
MHTVTSRSFRERTASEMVQLNVDNYLCCSRASLDSSCVDMNCGNKKCYLEQSCHVHPNDVANSVN